MADTGGMRTMAAIPRDTITVETMAVGIMVKEIMAVDIGDSLVKELKTKK